MKELKKVYAKNRAAWRSWLKKNHKKEQAIWLIIYRKKSETPSVYYEDAVEEALCFGWIDSKGNKRDDESYFLLMAQRKSKSGWGKINKIRIERLIREKKMTKAGLDKIEQAKENGSWNALDKIEEMIMPADLKKAFAKNKTARTHFDSFPPSTRKGIFNWIISAKQKETRDRRVNETVTLAEKNIRANEWRPKKA